MSQPALGSNLFGELLKFSMADTTLLTMDVGSTVEELPPSANNHTTRFYNGYLFKAYAEYAPSQKLKIELYRLKFLIDCRACKRPPPSLRFRGASHSLYPPNFSWGGRTFLKFAKLGG